MTETKKKILVKGDFLRKRVLNSEEVPVPEWGGVVLVREMTAAERDLYEQWTLEENADKTEIRARLVAFTVIDEDGKPVFSDIDIPDIKKLSGKIIARITRKSFELSGMLGEAREELTKNSDAAPTDDSPSPSVENSGSFIPTNSSSS